MFQSAQLEQFLDIKWSLIYLIPAIIILIVISPFLIKINAFNESLKLNIKKID